MTEKVASPRWFIIVHRERRELYSDLRRNFKPDKRVQVILDRRWAERRAESESVDSDRRRHPRRKLLTARETDLWETAGFRLYYGDEEIRVYEKAPGRPTKGRMSGGKRVTTRRGRPKSGR